MAGSMITGKTVLCGLIGDPIAHSLSPLMYNAAFQKLGLDYVYVAFCVRAEELPAAVAGMRALHMRGWNVTMPHKVAVMPLLDGLDTRAQQFGAVNTVVNDGGILKGYNTDADGFLRALQEGGVAPGGKRVVLLGAGGAARAIARVLVESDARLVIINRSLEHAEKLAGEISRISRQEIKALQLSEMNLEKMLADADILVNTTSVGMVPGVDETPVPARLLRSSLVVNDIIPNPAQTRLLREAEAIGAHTISGVEMLLWQGVLAFEKWTGQPAPVAVMRRALLRALRHED